MRTFSQYLKESPAARTIIMSFGRCNPPHRGHKGLFDTLVSEAQARHAESVMFVNPKQSVPKNPLHIDDKIKFIHAMQPKLTVKYDATVKDPEDIMAKYAQKGYKHLVIVEGEDRKQHMHELIDPLIKSGHLGFESWEFVSAMSRTSTAAWSATQQRDAAAKNDFKAFYTEGLPPGYPERLAKEMFDKTRKGMGIHEGEEDWSAGKLDEDDSEWSSGHADD